MGLYWLKTVGGQERAKIVRPWPTQDVEYRLLDNEVVEAKTCIGGGVIGSAYAEAGGRPVHVVAGKGRIRADGRNAVSYTHLTLPTSDLV